MQLTLTSDVIRRAGLSPFATQRVGKPWTYGSVQGGYITGWRQPFAMGPSRTKHTENSQVDYRKNTNIAEQQ